jgi:indole-3-glycerol phosphate synthase
VKLLSAILASKAGELDGLGQDQRVRQASRHREPIDVVSALRRRAPDPGGPSDTTCPALNLIAEVKLRSPSAGPLSRALTPAERALAYADAGVAMVSVLCDAKFFDGAWEHVSQVRGRLDETGKRLPVLAKEFVIDQRQIREARDRGADAILLIARIVSSHDLVELVARARDMGVEPLVEVTDERELDGALAAGARVIGVNARDLDSLEMDAARAARVIGAIGADSVVVHFSGVRDASDIDRIARGRADAALVGEVLMRDDDPRERLVSLVKAGKRPRETF